MLWRWTPSTGGALPSTKLPKVGAVEKEVVFDPLSMSLGTERHRVEQDRFVAYGLPDGKHALVDEVTATGAMGDATVWQLADSTPIKIAMPAGLVSRGNAADVRPCRTIPTGSFANDSESSEPVPVRTSYEPAPDLAV